MNQPSESDDFQRERNQLTAVVEKLEDDLAEIGSLIEGSEVYGAVFYSCLASLADIGRRIADLETWLTGQFEDRP